MRVLAVGAHPDDIEMMCAGTLAKCRKRGDEIFMSYLCNGNKGGYDIAPEELARIRKKEAEDSAKVIGAEIMGGFFPDLELINNEEALRVAIDLVRIARPDFIITHSPDDYMVDHTNTSGLVIDASFIATLPNYKTGHPAHALIPPVFYMENAGGVNFIPNEYVDITDFIGIKEKMLLCHQSQYKWLLEHDKINYVEFMRSISGFRGIQCGAGYAEGFRQYQVWGRMKALRLLP
jgi:LmbE family N-acetylglucosaminyl deacetylase